MPESAAFDALAREFFSVWFRFHPEAALATGVGDYGNLLVPQSDDEHAALGSWLETLIVALEELDFTALDRNRRLDAELMFSLARVEHQALLERDWRRRDPLRFLPLTEIHHLTLLRPPRMRDDLLALLEAIPAHLRLAITQLMPMAELIPPPLVAAAIDAAAAGPAYLRQLTRSRWLKAHCHGTAELESAAETASAALVQFAATLRTDIAPRACAPSGCGAEHLGFVLRHRHRLEVAPADCEALLSALAQTLAQAAEGARPAAPGAGKTPAASPAEGLGAECARQQALLRTRALCSLPAAPLRVSGGPACPRPGAAAPAPATWLLPDLPGVDYVPDLTRGQGTLYTADGNSACALDATVARLRCLQLGWGGRHTLTFAGGMLARSLPRLLAGGASLTRGWPLALAELIGDDADGLPAADVLAAQQGAVTHAMLELDLHLGRVGPAAARQRAAALGDPDCILAGLIRNPGDALAAVLGWQLIRAARARLAAAAGAAFDVRDFHDALLAHGPIPCALALAATHGEPLVRELTAAALTRPDAAS
jgi:hypothetical protein